MTRVNNGVVWEVTVPLSVGRHEYSFVMDSQNLDRGPPRTARPRRRVRPSQFGRFGQSRVVVVKRSVSVAMARALRYCVVIVGSAAVSLAAQVPDPLFKLDAASRFAVDATGGSAKALGLPWKFLLLRAQEGIAKGVDGRRIATAVKARFASLKDARAVLGNVSETRSSMQQPLSSRPRPDASSRATRPAEESTPGSQPRFRAHRARRPGHLCNPRRGSILGHCEAVAGWSGRRRFYGVVSQRRKRHTPRAESGDCAAEPDSRILGPSGKIPPSAGEPETPSP